MPNSSRLFSIVAIGSLIATGLYFASVLVLLALLQKPGVPQIVQGTAAVAMVIVPALIATRWTFNRLKRDYGEPTARAAAKAFGLSYPVALAISLLLAPMVGGYTEILLKTESYWFVLSSLMIGIIAMVALMTFITTYSAVWIERQ